MSDVFLIVEQHGGEVKRSSLELLSEFKRQGATPVCLVPGDSGAEATATVLGEHGAQKVVCLVNDQLKDYTTEGYTNALHGFLKDQTVGVLACAATAQGKDLLPRLAARLDAGLAADCVEFGNSGGWWVRRPVYAGKCSKKVTWTGGPAVFSVRPNTFAEEQSGGSAEKETVNADVGTIRGTLVEVMASQKKTVDLTEADIIISGGRSLKSEENFKIIFDCAEAAGAAAGASRAAVDAGYAPPDMQVGQTGKTVSPKLYIACGISGAIQHLAGMRTSKVIVAINTDPEAPIFSKADYGIVGDLFTVVPLLTEELKALKAQG